MIKPFNIIKTAPGILVLQKSKLHQLVRALFSSIGFMGFCVAGYLIIKPDLSAASEFMPWLLYLIVPLVLFLILMKIRSVLQSEDIIFDGNTQTISKKGQVVAGFVDVVSLDIKKTLRGDNFEYQLSLTCSGMPPCDIAQGRNCDDLIEVSEELSSFLEIKVIDHTNTAKILDWDGTETDSNINFQYAPSNLSKVLQLGLDPVNSPYTHKDIARWCDNFYCEYLDTEIPPEIDRLLPILEEIREKWDSLYNPSSLQGNPVFSSESINEWLRRIEA